MKAFDYATGIQTSTTEYSRLAQDILAKILKVKRSVSNCQETCSYCQAPHLKKVIHAVKKQEPIQFVLPAFPGKSPNSQKVLGHLPDMAEEKSLLFLNMVCDSIKEIYSPGAEIIICSDGRVFSDVVGISEKHVSEYQVEIEKIIEKNELLNLSTFTMDEICQGKSFTSIREALVRTHGRPLDLIREEVKKGQSEASLKEIHRMYCGLVKFLVEDSLHPDMVETKSQIQKVSRKKAYLMIQRSNAWTRLIEELFPDAVRLSIHPQSCGSKKLGIQLLGKETWMTPWHGVAVKMKEEFVLMKRWQAEDIGAALKTDEFGRASFYEVQS